MWEAYECTKKIRQIRICEHDSATPLLAVTVAALRFTAKDYHSLRITVKCRCIGTVKASSAGTPAVSAFHDQLMRPLRFNTGKLPLFRRQLRRACVTYDEFLLEGKHTGELGTREGREICT